MRTYDNLIRDVLEEVILTTNWLSYVFFFFLNEIYVGDMVIKKRGLRVTSDHEIFPSSQITVNLCLFHA